MSSHLTRLTLRNFRNYGEAHLTFSPTVNLILGENGQGKTNLLEAIYLISTGRSFRTRRLCDLIRSGENYFYIEAHFFKEGIEQALKIYYDDTTRKVQYNATAYTTFTSLLGILPGVLLSPDDHSLVSGTPTERRRFLDLHIAQMDPLYVHHLARYFRSLKQRNQLLRLRQEESLSAWEEMMALSGAYLILRRKSAIEALQTPAARWMEELSGNRDALTITYTASSPVKQEELTEWLKNQWKSHRKRDMHLGSTQFGPHRDDLDLQLSERPAKIYSSEGQKRSTAAALRLAEWQRLEASIAEKPLIGIDDFGIQLDERRNQILQEQMRHLGQVFLTSPRHLLSDYFPTDLQTIQIHKGLVTS